MISESDALERILAAVLPGSCESIRLRDASRRFCREDVFAQVAVPPFDNSAMDGYAIHADDCGQSDRWIEVIGTQAAGAAGVQSVRSGAAMRIFTGAPIPGQTAAIVMQEDVELRDDGAQIRIREPVEAGEFIRRRGADLCPGQKIISSGEFLSPQKIAVLAAQGIGEITVGRRPRVTILTTGDELIEVGRPLPHDAAIFDSNGPMIESLAAALDVSSTARKHVGDDPEALTTEINHALAESDVLITAGGVSVGARDFVKEALANAGFEVSLWRIALKPGKPFLFATRDPGPSPAPAVIPTLAFGLPGNPVSAFVTFWVFVAPALRRWQGAAADSIVPRRFCARLTEAIANRSDRPHYLRVICDPNGDCRPAGLQESHAVFGLSRANALLRLPAGTSFPAGGIVSVLPI